MALIKELRFEQVAETDPTQAQIMRLKEQLKALKASRGAPTEPAPFAVGPKLRLFALSIGKYPEEVVQFINDKAEAGSKLDPQEAEFLAGA